MVLIKTLFILRDGKYYYEGEHWAESKEDKSNKDKFSCKYFEYSNLNYGVLATIFEKATGTQFDLYMSEHLDDAYGLLIV